MAWLGSPQLPRSISLSMFATGAVVIAILLLAFLAFGEYTRRVRVQGIVLPTEGVTRVLSPAAGWIRSMPVKEGAVVRQGDVLYVMSLDSMSMTSRGGTQLAVIDLLRQRRAEMQADLERRSSIDAGKKQNLREQEQNLAIELAQADAQIRLARESANTLRKWMEQQRENLERGIATRQQIESRQQSYMNQESQLEALKRERIQINSKLSDVRNQLLTFDVQSASDSGQLRQQIIDINRQISEGEAKREITITAPRSGRVTGVISQAGQMLTAGVPMLTILPNEAPLEVQLLAPSDAIGFVRAGDRVLLRYEAFPYQRFGQFPGTVSLISRATLRPEEVQLLTGGADERQTKSVYRITVRPDQDYVLAYNRKEPLQVGMQLEAHILADSRPLYQWVLDPLYSLRGRMFEDAAKGL
ncbi:Colicin V secretion protein CvaA [Ensifer sesbaniae]|nr:Colicin V secretion protein CvaA [Ensifer sesbaniae]